MNFLAHFFLSGNSVPLRIGNFIGDFVKGNDYRNYPSEMQKGIILHRKIDSYTDNHPVVLASKKIFYDSYHKYSGILTDIIFDHYLTVQWDYFSDVTLHDYIEESYKMLLENARFLPLEISMFITKFVDKRWLDEYHSLDGIERVFRGMVKNTSLPDKTNRAMEIIKENYQLLNDNFMIFFPELIDYCNNIENQVI